MILGRLDKIAAWMLPVGGYADHDTARRARLFVAAHLVSPAIAFALAAILYGALGVTSAALLGLVLGFATFYVYPFLLRKILAFRWAAYLSTAQLTVLVILTIYFFDGFTSFALPWLAAMPMVGMLYLGFRGALSTSALAAAGLLAFYALHLSGHAFPNPLPASGMDTMLFASIGLAVAFTTGIAILHVTLQNLSRRDVGERGALLAHAQKMAELGSWQIDYFTNEVFWSDEVYRIVGLEVSEFDGRQASFLDCVHPDDRDLIARQTEDLKNGRPYDYNYRIVRPSGEQRIVNVQGEVTAYEDGLRRRAQGFIQDVTERERAQRALRESEAQLGEAQRIARVGSWVWDAQTNALQWSDEHYRIFGIEPVGSEITYDQFLARVHPDDRTRVIEIADTMRASGEFGSIEYRIVRPDGETRFVRAWSEAVFEGDQIPRLMRGAAQDITERVRAEQALRESEESIRLIADNVPALISYVDSEQCYRFMNERYEEWSLRPNAERQGRPVWESLGKDYYDRLAPWITRALNGERVRFEIYNKFPDGKVRFLDIEYVPDVGADGRTKGYYSVINDISDRKRMEESLQASEQRYRSLIEDQPDYVCRYRPDGRLIYANTAFAKQHGFDAGDISGVNVFDFIAPQDRPRARDHVAQLRPEHESERIEFQVVVADGAIRWQEWTDRAFFDGSGRLFELQSFGRDVTDRKTADQQLRNSEARLAEAQQLAQIGSWERYFGSRQSAWSDQLFRLYGVEPDTEEPSNALFLTSVHPDDRAEVKRILKAQELLGGLDNYGHRIVRPNGEVRFVQQRVEQIFDEPGELIGVRGTAQDITELKRAEDDLRESEERFRGIIENSPTAVFLKDMEGRFQIVNSKFEEWYGFRIDEIAGKTSHNIYPKEFADIYVALDREVMVREQTQEREHVVPFADDTLHTVVITKFPVRDGTGKIVGVGTINSDITAHKESEERFQQAQKMEAVGQLTGGIAHDFYNLLAVMLGNLELIRERLDADSSVNDMIERGIMAAERGAALTGRLLAFSRKQTLLPTTIDMNRLVAEMTELLRRTLGERIDIKSSAAEDLWFCRADRGQLESALLNLSINARDAMPGGGRLTVETANISVDDEYAAAQAELEPGEYVMLGVSDSGSGISGATLKHVFEPFFTTKDVGRGSGLGLSMVYGFAKQSGGNVTIYSEPGQGTSVKLYLPRASGENEDAGLSRAAPDVPAAQGERILVVEDDADVRTLAVALLSGLGYEIAEAGSAEAGLEVMQHLPPIDLLLSDVVLPGAMNGSDLADEVRNLSPTTKIV